ncbi:MAG: hypothetical protein R6V02_05695 [Candidatus Aminicenantes bacterium]
MFPRAKQVGEKNRSVRSEYTSARLIVSNLEHRLSGNRFERPPGYLPPEVDYRTGGGRSSFKLN